MSSPDVLAGEVAPEVLAEFPGLEVATVLVAVPARSTPKGLAAQLDLAAERINGPVAVRAATGQVAGAYRAFMRQLGMDPASVEGTLDAIVKRRLVEGGFRAGRTVVDASALATLELGVPIATFHPGAAGEAVNLVVADRDGSRNSAGDLMLERSGTLLARLFGGPIPEALPRPGDSSVTLVAVGAPGLASGYAGLALERAAELISFS